MTQRDKPSSDQRGSEPCTDKLCPMCKLPICIKLRRKYITSQSSHHRPILKASKSKEEQRKPSESLPSPQVPSARKLSRKSSPNSPSESMESAVKLAPPTVPHRKSSSRNSASDSSIFRIPSSSSSWYDSRELGSLREEFVLRINQIRASLSLSAVIPHPLLNICAAEHNYNQAFVMKSIDHEGIDGSHAGDRLKRIGYRYRWYGENLAYGQENVAWVVNSLMKSPGHRKNIVNERAVEMGVHGGVGRNGRWYWTQILAARKRER